MKRRLAGLAIFVLALTGCGGGGGGGSDNRPQVGGQIVGGTINCLIDENWLVQPGEENQIIGTSDRGVTFKLTIYATVGEAKKNKGKGEVVDTGVAEFNTGGSQQAGGQQHNVEPTTESAAIKRCLQQAKA